MTEQENTVSERGIRKTRKGKVVSKSGDKTITLPAGPDQWALKIWGGVGETVGFTAAAVFCRWAERRKLKAPSVTEVLQQLES